MSGPEDQNPQDQRKEAFLGDGVYAVFDGWSIRLDTRAQSPMHRIVLEPEVIRKMHAFLEECWGAEITIRPKKQQVFEETIDELCEGE